MLAFLQATWVQKPELSKYVLASISFLAAGVFLAGLVQFFRYHTSFSLQGGKIYAFKIYRFLYLAAVYTSLVAFLSRCVGCCVWGVVCVALNPARLTRLKLRAAPSEREWPNFVWPARAPAITRSSVTAPRRLRRPVLAPQVSLYSAPC
jgi:hypothetical protein